MDNAKPRVSEQRILIFVLKIAGNFLEHIPMATV